MSNNKKNILNIGAGGKIIKEAVSLDVRVGPGIDIVCDVRKGLPFADKRFNEVVADYFLQQICDGEKFVYVLNEIWRVLKIGGLLKLRVPNAEYPVAFKDPFDCRAFTKETFDYFNKDHYRFKYYRYGFKPWIIVKIEEIGGCQNPELRDRLYVEMKKYGEGT